MRSHLESQISVILILLFSLFFGGPISCSLFKKKSAPVTKNSAPPVGFRKTAQGFLVAYLPTQLSLNQTIPSSLGSIPLENVDLLVLKSSGPATAQPGANEVLNRSGFHSLFADQRSGLEIWSRTPGQALRGSLKGASKPSTHDFSITLWNGSKLVLHTFTQAEAANEADLSKIAKNRSQTTGPRIFLGPLLISDQIEKEKHLFERHVLPHWVPVNAMVGADQTYTAGISSDLYDGLNGWRLNRKNLPKTLAGEIIFELIPASSAGL